MKRQLLLSLLLMAAMTIWAQTVYKVDINEYSRNNMDEVLEPGFTAWKVKTKDFKSDELQVDGVTSHCCRQQR